MVPLFNGKDITGWNVFSDSHWVVEDGALYLKDRTDGQEHNDAYLWTDRMYGDFVLDLEFRVPEERANSGVFLRTSVVKDPVQTGIEIQVSNPRPGGPPTRGAAGAIYDLVTPTRSMYRPNAWNRYLITCKGNNIAVVWNGELVAEMDLDLWKDARKNPDGSGNKFTRPLKNFARTGYIGLQDHGRPVWFRNIRIRTLDK